MGSRFQRFIFLPRYQGPIQDPFSGISSKTACEWSACILKPAWEKAQIQLDTHDAYEPVEHEGGGGVVGAVVEGRRGVVLPRVVALLEVRAPRRVQGADRLELKVLIHFFERSVVSVGSDIPFGGTGLEANLPTRTICLGVDL